MTKEEMMEKDKALGEAVAACIERAEELIEGNSGDCEIRGLFTIYCDMKSIRVRSVGHSLALDSVYRRASTYMLARQLQEAERIEAENR